MEKGVRVKGDPRAGLAHGAVTTLESWTTATVCRRSDSMVTAVCSAAGESSARYFPLLGGGDDGKLLLL